MAEFIIRYWLEALFGVILAILGLMYGYLTKKFKKLFQEYAAIKLGNVAMLRDRIIQEYNKYIILGEIPRCIWPTPS